ncbi:hypothetical protein [Tabrizicola sp.]|uniref:hypothetical protein n=1 Tax=Tabrizicola sp. TaxID=2005166 RepID=UPI003F312CEA
MDLNGLLNMLTKMFIRSAVDTGIDYAARKGKPDAELTPEEREQAQSAKNMAQRAREVSKVVRRLWR